MTHRSSSQSDPAPPQLLTSTTESGPYGFATTPTPPRLNNRGKDFVEIARSLLSFDDWIEAQDPDPALIPQIAAPASTFDRAIRNDVDVLRRLNRRFYEIQDGRDRITVTDRRADLAVLHDDQPLRIQRVIDARGVTKSEKKYSLPYTRYTVVIAHMADGRWLIADIELVTS